VSQVERLVIAFQDQPIKFFAALRAHVCELGVSVLVLPSGWAGLGALLSRGTPTCSSILRCCSQGLGCAVFVLYMSGKSKCKGLAVTAGWLLGAFDGSQNGMMPTCCFSLLTAQHARWEGPVPSWQTAASGQDRCDAHRFAPPCAVGWRTCRARRGGPCCDGLGGSDAGGAGPGSQAAPPAPASDGSCLPE